MGAPVAFFDITSPDPARIGDFYWKLVAVTVAPEQDDYRMVDTGKGEGSVFGGIGQAQESSPAGITVYVRVADLGETLAQAEKLGGATVVPPTDLPGGYGRFAVLADPDGNAFGLWACPSRRRHHRRRPPGDSRTAAPRHPATSRRPGTSGRGVR